MKLYRNNGEEWYVQRHSLLKHLRIWLIWLGGWEKVNHTGWQFRRQQIGYVPPRYRWIDPYPISLFGHRITFQHFGFNIRLRRGYLCFNHEYVNHGPNYRRRYYCYFSPNATPWAATTWLYGAPREVVQEAEQNERDFYARQAEYKRKDQEAQREAERYVAEHGKG